MHDMYCVYVLFYISTGKPQLPGRLSLDDEKIVCTSTVVCRQLHSRATLDDDMNSKSEAILCKTVFEKVLWRDPAVAFHQLQKVLGWTVVEVVQNRLKALTCVVPVFAVECLQT